ncbi:MAG: S8 family serine peptidase, partial [Acidobacteriota bacterium]
DHEKFYPASFRLGNMLVATASTKDDKQDLNYGDNTVHLAAPGIDVEVLTWKGKDVTTVVSGTSYSTAFVAGAAALIKSEYPNASVKEIKFRILDNVAMPKVGGNYPFKDTTCSDGRLNLAEVLKKYPAGTVWKLPNNCY